MNDKKGEKSISKKGSSIFKDPWFKKTNKKKNKNNPAVYSEN